MNRSKKLVLKSYFFYPIHSVPYSDQVAKKHKLGARYLNTLRKKVHALPEINDAGKEQIAWTNTL